MTILWTKCCWKCTGICWSYLKLFKNTSGVCFLDTVCIFYTFCTHFVYKMYTSYTCEHDTIRRVKGMSDERQNRQILSADKIERFCQPRQNMFYLRRFCRLTFRISDNKFCLCCHGDCLQVIIYCVCYYFHSLDAEKSDASIILRSAFGCCASW